MFLKLGSVFSAVLLFSASGVGECRAATTYSASNAFESGWKHHHNPNGVWSYGYSAGFTGPVTLYGQTLQNGVNGPNAQYWLDPATNLGNSPSAEYNDGPAYDNGNVHFAERQFLLVSGIGGEFSDLVFTAPANGQYSIAGVFRGCQYGIGVAVGIVINGTTAFSSSVHAVNQKVSFKKSVALNAGQTVVFSVGPAGGLQNTGLSATITKQ